MVTSLSIIEGISISHLDAKSQEVDPEMIDYHLKLAQGILDMCYARNVTTNLLTPNPTAPMFSDLSDSCKKKINTLDKFLADFVDDTDGKRFAEHIGNGTYGNKSIES